MTELVAYLFVAYSVVAALLVVLWKLSSTWRRDARWIAAGSSLVALLLPLLPYALVEVTTALYRHQVRPVILAKRDLWGIELPISQMKVLRVNRKEALVYVVSSCRNDYRGVNGHRGELVWLTRTRGGWATDDHYETIWSDCGGADRNIFPPYPN